MIYTSYFKFPGLVKIETQRKVAISIGVPPAWKGRRYLELAPTRAMLKMSISQYYKLYDTILSKLDPFKVGQELEGKILICWEKNPLECHRSYVGQWLNKAGFKCEELSGGSPVSKASVFQTEIPWLESRPPVQ